MKLLRVHQWVKNLFIFLPIFFSKHITEIEYIIPSTFVFMAFCFISSSIYCFNDIYDVDSDRKHPVKCKRPIASGKVSIRTAYIIMFALVILSSSIIVLGFYKDVSIAIRTMSIILFYFFMNIAYCIKLKQVAIIDTFIIATGFVLRVVIGGVATNIWISHWIILMTFLLALFLAFAKRRDDVVIYKDTGIKIRNNINRYNIEFMNQAISIIAAIIIVSYIMYTVSTDVIERFNSSYLYITTIWVLLGVLRYLQITIVDVKSGSPTKVLAKDRFIQVSILGWIITFLFIIYF